MNEMQSLCRVIVVDPVISSQVAGAHPAVMEQSKWRLGGKGSDLWVPFGGGRGSGIVTVIGLWNLRLRGSRVTTGEKAALLPTILLTTYG